MNLMHTIRNLYSINEEKELAETFSRAQMKKVNESVEVETDLDALFEEELFEANWKLTNSMSPAEAVEMKESAELEEAVNAKEKGRLSFKFGRKPEHNPYPEGSDDAKDWSAGYSAAKAAEKKRDPKYQAK